MPAGPLITQKDLNTGCVTFPKRKFDAVTGKAKQARVFFSFTSANVPVSMPHALGRVPTSFSVVASGGVDTAGGATLTAPGVVYSASAMPGQALTASRNVISLACSVAHSWAEVLVS